MKILLNLFCIIFICISPVIADKSKGGFTGNLYPSGLNSIETFQPELDSFTSKVSEKPSYVSDNQFAIQSNLQDTEDWMDIGKAQLIYGFWKSAEEMFYKVIDKDPTKTDGWEGYLLAIWGGENFESLLDASERATKENPNFASAWIYNGIALSSLDRSEEALTAFDKALDIDPKLYEAWYYKGIAFDSLKRYSDSVNAYERVVALNESFAKAWNNEGVALLYLGNYDKAIIAFDQALLIDPEFKKASKNKELAMQEKGNNSPDQVVIVDDGRESFIAQDDSGWSLSMNTNGQWHYSYCIVPSCEPDTQNPKTASGTGKQRLHIGYPKELGVRAWVSGPGDGLKDYELHLYYGSTLVSQVIFPLKGEGIFGVFNPSYNSSSDDKTVTCRVNAVSQGVCTRDGIEFDCRPP